MSPRPAGGPSAAKPGQRSPAGPAESAQPPSTPYSHFRTSRFFKSLLEPSFAIVFKLLVYKAFFQDGRIHFLQSSRPRRRPPPYTIVFQYLSNGHRRTYFPRAALDLGLPANAVLFESTDGTLTSTDDGSVVCFAALRLLYPTSSTVSLIALSDRSARPAHGSSSRRRTRRLPYPPHGRNRTAAENQPPMTLPPASVLALWYHPTEPLGPAEAILVPSSPKLNCKADDGDRLARRLASGYGRPPASSFDLTLPPAGAALRRILPLRHPVIVGAPVPPGTRQCRSFTTSLCIVIAHARAQPYAAPQPRAPLQFVGSKTTILAGGVMLSAAPRVLT
ncbi:hypothetical protein DFH07DRAFT_949524 [Mycena maculata]|uniref:Uncharacterized protein n=1 Tax=Mycena maculata TaxID=230809 RepID=A0AAD7KAX4_9AGAR|nr:hypothetical protein DFH07DRAFT_949524 [Mycena maculata]